jgi:hypothetical protein
MSAKRLPVCAEQHVLPVVERDAVDDDAARPSAERLRLLEQRDLHAGCCERDRCRTPGPSSADDGDARRRAFNHGAPFSKRSRACAAA